MRCFIMVGYVSLRWARFHCGGVPSSVWNSDTGQTRLVMSKSRLDFVTLVTVLYHKYNYNNHAHFNPP